MSKKRKQIQVSLRPNELKHLENYCEKTSKQNATVIREIYHAAMEGILVTRTGRNYFNLE